MEVAEVFYCALAVFPTPEDVIESQVTVLRLRNDRSEERTAHAMTTNSR